MEKAYLNNVGKDLSGEDLSKLGLDYAGADFSGAKLIGTNLSGLNLQGANFTQARIRNAKFTGANLKRANFTKASVGVDPEEDAIGLGRTVDFRQAKIQGTVFRKAQLPYADFYEAKAGLTPEWKIVVIILSALFCLLSGFATAILTTFTVHSFIISPRQGLPLPNQKSPILVLLFIGIWSILLITAFRTILNNCISPISLFYHVVFAITTILLSLLFAALLMDDAKHNIGSLLGIAIIVLSPLLLLLITPALAGFEESLASKIPLLAQYVVKGLGINPSNDPLFVGLCSSIGKVQATEGKWVSGIYGAAIGAVFGCWFSQLAIAGDKRFAWLWKPYLNFLSISSTTFRGSNLTGASFSSAMLQGASFKNAVINRIVWTNARCLDCTQIGDTYLKYPEIRQLVVRGVYENQDQNTAENSSSSEKVKVKVRLSGLDLKGINLEEVDLKNAELIGTNLCEANLRNATLIKANLTKASLEGADLRGAKLTGAIIQGWSIDETTNLSGVECGFVFLKNEVDPFSGVQERLPAFASEEIFEDGDFETIFGRDSLTTQILIRNSDNRQALATAFQRLIRDTHSVLQGFEMIGDNALVKIRASQSMSKASLLSKFYNTFKEVKTELQDSDRKDYKNEPLFNFLLNLIKEIMSDTPKNDLRGATIGNFAVTNQGHQEASLTIQNSTQRQTLSEAAEEIQKLLKQLEQSNPTATDSDKIVYVSRNTNSNLKQRVTKVLQAGGEAAIDEFLDNPYINIGKAIIKAWLGQE